MWARAFPTRSVDGGFGQVGVIPETVPLATTMSVAVNTDPPKHVLSSGSR